MKEFTRIGECVSRLSKWWRQDIVEVGGNFHITGGWCFIAQITEGEVKLTRIDKTKFGSITINGERYKHDVLIRLDGKVKKRKKKLSKQIYGTSHILSIQEARYVYEQGAERMIFGTGQFGRAKLSDEAEEFFNKKGCKVELLPTPEAIKVWNVTEGASIGLFHVTC